MGTDGRSERGNQTRRAILGRSMQIASVEGLGGLSLGRVATELSVSKSNVFALFGSMEGLQLATIRAARAVYIENVITPALTEPPGLPRLTRTLTDWLAYSRGRVFEGGCFFFAVSAEFDARTGPLHDAIAAVNREWIGYLEGLATDGAANGTIRPGIDPGQVVFELNAYLETANSRSLLHRDDHAYDRARVAVLDRLATITP